MINAFFYVMISTIEEWKEMFMFFSHVVQTYVRSGHLLILQCFKPVLIFLNYE